MTHSHPNPLPAPFYSPVSTDFLYKLTDVVFPIKKQKRFYVFQHVWVCVEKFEELLSSYNAETLDILLNTHRYVSTFLK